MCHFSQNLPDAGREKIPTVQVQEEDVQPQVRGVIRFPGTFSSKFLQTSNVLRQKGQERRSNMASKEAKYCHVFCVSRLWIAALFEFSRNAQSWQCWQFLYKLKWK